MKPWTTCERCGTHSCIEHTVDDCQRSLEYQELCKRGDEVAISAWLEKENERLEATCPVLYCEWCGKTLRALSHKHFSGKRLMHEAIVIASDESSEGKTTLRRVK